MAVDSRRNLPLLSSEEGSICIKRLEVIGKHDKDSMEGHNQRTTEFQDGLDHNKPCGYARLNAYGAYRRQFYLPTQPLDGVAGTEKMPALLPNYP
jgi:hypothetical protein